MTAHVSQIESACRKQIDRFFAAYPDAVMQQRAHKALRLLRTLDEPVKGKPEGWASGIIYAVFNDGKIPVGVPGILNSEFEQFMGVTMSTTRQRAARVRELFTF